jgi:hypothetical protein
MRMQRWGLNEKSMREFLDILHKNQLVELPDTKAIAEVIFPVLERLGSRVAKVANPDIRVHGKLDLFFFFVLV